MRLPVAAACLFVFAAPAFSQEAPPEPGRYAVQPSADGFVRLDTRTGAVSHCSKEEGVWRCEPFADTTPAVDPRVGALSAEVAALKAKVGELTARIDALSPLTTGDTVQPAPDHAPTGFAETLVGRLFALVRELKGNGE